ncbi:MAG: phosphatidylcholine/phosphatidylserine synthase [Holosporaceae bacterium]|jgi:CDP-diacylglycerol--serine O-phosphatidyltransferase|nr:phosphatidylcholine/phosphatidylserine synthase [Holosporaceae bacterium]
MLKEEDCCGENVEQCEECSRKDLSLARFLPSVITISAMCVGLTAIRFALFRRWEEAVLCIFTAALLDALDGRVARFLGNASQLGAQLDSLSDLVCFGVAPAVLLFMKSMHLYGVVGWGVCMFFTVCCALRLARFNADMLRKEPKDTEERKYFKGVPAPAGAMISVLPLVIFFQTEHLAPLNPEYIVCSLFLSGVFMISSIRTFSSKIIEISNGSAPLVLLGTSIFVICLLTEVWLTLSVLVGLYIISILFSANKYYQAQRGSEEAKDIDEGSDVSEKAQEETVEEEKALDVIPTEPQPPKGKRYPK